MKIYLAHSLTYAPDEFVQEMSRLRHMLKQTFEVLDFFSIKPSHPLGNSQTVEDVYSHDIACVKACDMVLAEVSYPATALGFEIATALDLGKKVLAVGKKEAKVSRLILGIKHPNYRFVFYDQIEDILKFL